MYLNHFPHVNNGLLFVRFMILFLILYDIYIKIYFSWAKLRASSFDITVLACTLGHFCICVHVAIWQRPLLHVVLLYLDFKVWGASIVFFSHLRGNSRRFRWRVGQFKQRRIGRILAAGFRLIFAVFWTNQIITIRQSLSKYLSKFVKVLSNFWPS